VRNGVTSVRDVGGNLDTISGLSRRVERGDVVGPAIFFAGPLLTKAPVLGATKGMNAVIPETGVGVTSPADVDSMLDRLVAGGASMVKAIDYWDPLLFRYLVKAARARSLPVVLDPGVAILNTIPIDTALALGVTSIEHSQAAWAGILNAETARVRDSVMEVGLTSGEPDLALRRMMALGEQSVSRERLAHLADTWVRSGAYFTPTLQIAIDAVARTPEGEWRRAFEGRLAVSWLAVRILASHGVKMLVGQDGIEPDGALREMDLLASVGISPAEILRGATIYPARWLGVDSTVGTLEPGKRADILILEANPLERITNIRSAWTVLSRGRIILGPKPQ
jgi:imidazolonepropionase-like amidohydrolase